MECSQKTEVQEIRQKVLRHKTTAHKSVGRRTIYNPFKSLEAQTQKRTRARVGVWREQFLKNYNMKWPV